MTNGAQSTLSSVRAWLGRLFAFGGSVTGLSAALAAGALLLAFVADLGREVVVLESFKVAATIDATPADNALLSEQLVRDMRLIVQEAQTEYDATPLRPEGYDRLAHIEVPSELGTIRALLVALRDALGRAPTRVHCAAVHTPAEQPAGKGAGAQRPPAESTAVETGTWTVSVRVERGPELGGDSLIEKSAPALKEAVSAVALPLLDQLDPFAVSMYLYQKTPEAWDADIAPRLWRMLTEAPAHDDAWAHNLWGVRELERGAFDDAIEHFRQAIRLNGGLQLSHYNLGLALRRRGAPLDYSEAIVAYKRAFSGKRALRARSAYNLAWLYAERKMHREAKDAAAMAVREYPSFTEAYWLMAYLRALELDGAGVNRAYRLAMDFSTDKKLMLLQWAQTLETIADPGAAGRYRDALLHPGRLTVTQHRALCDGMRRTWARDEPLCEQRLAMLIASEEL